MLEGIPGTEHTLPLLIFHGTLHAEVHMHLTGRELFVHVEMALQPGSLCKPSLFFKFKSTIHWSWEQHITQPLWPVGVLLMQTLCHCRWAADFGRCMLGLWGTLLNCLGCCSFSLRGSKGHYLHLLFTHPDFQKETSLTTWRHLLHVWPNVNCLVRSSLVTEQNQHF